jgi:hypothetical protein
LIIIIDPRVCHASSNRGWRRFGGNDQIWLECLACPMTTLFQYNRQ